MIRLDSKEFAEIIQELEKTTSATRREFFKTMSADKFLLWWFFYYSDDFITQLADFHYEWIEAIFSSNNVMIE